MLKLKLPVIGPDKSRVFEYRARILMWPSSLLLPLTIPFPVQ